MVIDGLDFSRPGDSRNFIHKKIIGAAKGFVTGGFTGAAVGFLTGGGPRANSRARAPRQRARFNPPFGGDPGFGIDLLGGRARLSAFEQPPMTRKQLMALNQALGASSSEAVARQTGAQLCCPGGMHANKTDYFVRERDGNGNFTGGFAFVAAGSRCVTNRRRNPLNPRALSRAMAREDSAVTLFDRLLPAPSRRASRKRSSSRKSSRKKRRR